MKIIVIDDLEINRQSATTLVEAGHEVVVIGDAEEGVRYLDYHDRPDMVLTDLWMPAPDMLVRRERSVGSDGHEGVQMNSVWYTRKHDRYFTPEIPIGLIVAIIAKNIGVQWIGILTDTDHHQDQMVTLCQSFDHGSVADFEWTQKKNESARRNIGLYEARYFENLDGSKNWLKLARFLSEGIASD